MANRLQKLCDRADELDVEEEAADLLENFLDQVDEALERFEDNREEAAAEIVSACVEIPSVLAALGELERIEYDRDEGGEPVRRYHDFEDARPLLAYDENGSLWIVGGDYTVTKRGIEG